MASATPDITILPTEQRRYTEFLPPGWLRIFCPRRRYWSLSPAGRNCIGDSCLDAPYAPALGGRCGGDGSDISRPGRRGRGTLDGDYNSVGGKIILILIFIVLNYLVNLFSCYVPFFERLVSAPPIQVVKDGQLLRCNMRHESLTEEELMET
jgi:hypothetical protein